MLGRNQDRQAVHKWNDWLMACRESCELRMEDCHMGQALLRLLISLDVDVARQWPSGIEPSYVSMFTLAAVHWNVASHELASGFLYAWLENQVAAAIKLVPLGQTDGQRVILKLMAGIDDCVAVALDLDDHELGGSLPGLAISSALHETQYSRLFRS